MTNQPSVPSRAEQLTALQSKQILVPMWGWPVTEMATAARQFGYEVVNSPHGNDLAVHAEEARVWSEAGLQMIVRPHLPVSDPFDPEEVSRGCEEIRKVIEFHDSNPNVLGYSIAWGLYGEGGFPPETVFSEQSIQAFNQHLGTPGQPLPEAPEPGQPGSLRYVQWLEFRSETLREFRRTFVRNAKQHTEKLVGTWSEFYPIENHALNMGDAPEADFLFYDLSFGDVTVNQSVAFAETHGNMQHHATFEDYRASILPKIGKSAGEGVVPMAFQFPMRRGHATDFLSETRIFIDRIEDEYSLRLGPDLRKVIDAMGRPWSDPEVAVVYHSYAAGALPGGQGPEFYFYSNGVRQVEGTLRQMGVNLKVIPFEHLRQTDLSNYKLVIIPDPLYLGYRPIEEMWKGLPGVERTLFLGEYGLAHRDPGTATGSYSSSFAASWQNGDTRLDYFFQPEAPIKQTGPACGLTSHLEIPEQPHPADQMFGCTPLPSEAEVLLEVGDKPLLFTTDHGRAVFITSRLAQHAWRAESREYEQLLWKLLENLLKDTGVEIRVPGPPVCPVNQGFPYGSYGVVGNIAYNETSDRISLTLSDGTPVVITPHNWSIVGDR